MFPFGGSNGWEDPSVTTIATVPRSAPLVAPAAASYYDPSPLGGTGVAVPFTARQFGTSTVEVRALGPNVEAFFAQGEVYGVALLDNLLFIYFAACALELFVYDDDLTTLLWSVGTDPLHPRPYLVDPENYAEQELDVAAGSATIGTVEVTVIDPMQLAGDQDSGWMSERLARLGLADVAGHRCRLVRYTDPSSPPVVIADGPAGYPKMDASYAGFSWDIRDTRETERKIPLTRSPQNTLLPWGVLGGYGYDAGTATYRVDPATPLLGRFDLVADLPLVRSGVIDLTSTPGNSSALRRISIKSLEQLRDILDESPFGTVPHDTTLAPWGVQFHWRIASSGNPWTVLQAAVFLEHIPSPGEEDIARLFTTLTVAGPPADMPDDLDDIEFLIVGPEGTPSEDFPLYFEGMSAGVFAEAVYLGIYSPHDQNNQPESTGVRFDIAAVGQLTDVVRLRVIEAVTDARDFLEKYIYTPTGWVPALDNDGRISPVSQIPPTNVSALDVVHNGITEPSSDWDAGQRIINVLRFTYPRDFKPVDPANAETVDGLADREIVMEFEDTVSVRRHGRQILEIDGRAFRAIGDENGAPLAAGTIAELGSELASLRQQYVEARYALGAPSMRLVVRRSALSTLRAGSWVILDLSWLPNYLTGRRGLLALAQVVAIADLDCAWRQITVEQSGIFDVSYHAVGAGQPGEQAVWSDLLVEFMGYNIRLSYTNTAYTENPAGSLADVIIPALVALRARHARDLARVKLSGGVGTSPDVGWMTATYARYALVAASVPNLGFTLVFQEPALTSSAVSTHDYTSDPLPNLMAYADPAYIEAFESLNEHDKSGRPAFDQEIRDFTAALRGGMDANVDLAALPLYGPATGDALWGSTIGDLSGDIAETSMHPYPGGREPLDPLGFIAHAVNAQAMGSALNLDISESGYHTTPNSTDGHNWVSFLAQAKSLLRMLFEYFQGGLLAGRISRWFLHELIDFRATDPTDIQEHFGLLENDGTPKPAFTALANAMAILEDAGAPFTPGTLAYTLDQTVGHLLLGRRDGSFLLVLWQQVPVFTIAGASSTDITNPDLNVRVQLAQDYDLQLYTPLSSATPSGVVRSDHLIVAVPDHPVIVRIA